MVLRMENPEAEIKSAKKRKRDTKPLTESVNIKLENDLLQPKKLKNKKVKSAPPVFRKQDTKLGLEDKEDIKETVIGKDISDRYPVLKNEVLMHQFLSVPMTNNQKGRIRQLLKDSLKGTSDFLLPDVINNKIQAVLNSSNPLTETDLRKIRILYNMLKTALTSGKHTDTKKKNKKPNKNKEKEKTDKKEVEHTKNGENTAKAEQGDGRKSVNAIKKKGKVEKDTVPKVKGPKRYVVFLGNLPPDIDKERILQHFSEFNECIVDIRIPKRPEGKKSCIAYVELKNEPSYELALSKHHSMLGSKRINVLYTTQKNGKVSKTEAKSKSAKLIALQKAGKLIGSIPVNRKRSHRRMKMKRAQAKLAAESA